MAAVWQSKTGLIRLLARNGLPSLLPIESGIGCDADMPARLPGLSLSRLGGNSEGRRGGGPGGLLARSFAGEMSGGDDLV